MTRKIPLINDLMADLVALPTEVVGSHLSDEELFDYIMGRVSVSKTEQIDIHLASCAACAEEADLLVDASLPWQGKAGERRLAALRERVLGKLTIPSKQSEKAPSLLERLAEQLRNIRFPDITPTFALAGAYADSAKALFDGQTEDGSLRWRIVQDQKKNLIVRFGSHELELEGQRVRLRIGEWERQVALRRVAPDQVGGEIVITRAERIELLAKMSPSIELVT